MGLFSQQSNIIDANAALPGRPNKMPVPATHFVSGHSMQGPFPDSFETAMFGMGCFWGVERKFWQHSGVVVTAAGYAGGITPNPTYEEVCSGRTGHNEVARMVYDPSVVTYQELLALFWENHDPTQGMRQGNDQGTQYRSGIYTFSERQLQLAKVSYQVFQKNLADAGYPAITTEILNEQAFYFAEDYHQQYLAKVPNGYCGVGGTGVCYVERSS